ncbi:MAG: HAD family hydrolase [Planctomycetota bacterium]
MNETWNQAVLSNRRPLEPLPTEITPRLGDLSDIQAVIFDVYGTLVVSGSGDVGVADETGRGESISAAMSAAGVAVDRIPSIERLHAVIRGSNDERRSEDCPKPEVDIVECWRQVLSESSVEASTEQCNRLAAEYESRANPTWPMPDAMSVLRQLSGAETRIGIVSNAQAFTLSLVEDLAGKFGVDSILDPNLCVFSNRYRQAKPGPRLFEVLRGGLGRLGIAPEQAVYVGNDRLNDVWSAHQAGLRTAWFAGDRRSLRDRRDDPRVADLPHDIVLTRLNQLLDCLGHEKGSENE